MRGYQNWVVDLIGSWTAGWIAFDISNHALLHMSLPGHFFFFSNHEQKYARLK